MKTIFSTPLNKNWLFKAMGWLAHALFQHLNVQVKKAKHLNRKDLYSLFAFQPFLFIIFGKQLNKLHVRPRKSAIKNRARVNVLVVHIVAYCFPRVYLFLNSSTCPTLCTLQGQDRYPSVITGEVPPSWHQCNLSACWNENLQYLLNKKNKNTNSLFLSHWECLCFRSEHSQVLYCCGADISNLWMPSATVCPLLALVVNLCPLNCMHL